MHTLYRDKNMDTIINTLKETSKIQSKSMRCGLKELTVDGFCSRDSALAQVSNLELSPHS